MTDALALLPVLTAFFVVAASPGPATLAVAAVSMRSGRASGLRFGLGLGVGLAFWGLVAATGLGAILQASSTALILLKLFGGVYLLWLAFGAVRSSRATVTTLDVPVAHDTGFRRGLLLNLSNPKAVVAWMATLSLGVPEANAAPQVAIATGLCIVQGFLIYAAYALAFSTQSAMGMYARLRRWVDTMVAALFALAAGALIRSALSSLRGDVAP